MAPSSWAPTPTEVGSLMPARFPRRGSGTAGPSADTNPTLDQVRQTIELLEPDLLEDVSLEDWGDDTFSADALPLNPPSTFAQRTDETLEAYAVRCDAWRARQRLTLAKLAKLALAARVAAWIENGFFPEQNADGTGGPAEYFRRRAQEQTERLRRKMVTLGRADLPRGR